MGGHAAGASLFKRLVKKTSGASVAAAIEKVPTAVVENCAPKQPDMVVVTANGEVPVHSQVLALASPVFKSMLESVQEESVLRRLKLKNQSKKEFLAFYQLLMPASGRHAKI